MKQLAIGDSASALAGVSFGSLSCVVTGDKGEMFAVLPAHCLENWKAGVGSGGAPLCNSALLALVQIDAAKFSLSAPTGWDAPLSCASLIESVRASERDGLYRTLGAHGRIRGRITRFLGLCEIDFGERGGVHLVENVIEIDCQQRKAVLQAEGGELTFTDSDAGSLVLTPDSNVVGMVIASHESLAYAVPLNVFMAERRVTFCSPDKCAPSAPRSESLTRLMETQYDKMDEIEQIDLGPEPETVE